MIAQQQLGTVTDLEQHASPALVQFAQTLALPSDALEELVEREVALNPALERRPCADDSRFGAPRADDFADVVADEPSDAELLLGAARLLLPASEHALAEAVAGSLTSRGFLPAGIDALAGDLGESPQRLERVVAALREAGPPGTAARGLRDCLLAQLDALGARDADHALARAVVDEHLPALAAGRLGAIAVALRVGVRDIAAARDLIRAELRPCAVVERPSARRPRAVVAPPEIAFRRSAQGGHDVEVLEASRFGLRVRPRDAAASAATCTARMPSWAASTSAGARCGRWASRSRCTRTRSCATARRMCDRSPAARIARELGVHESTVSRSVAGKHAALPAGGVVALSAFFATSCDARDALRDLVACEPRPLPDAALADAMRRRGFPVARRTVAKYRDSLGIPPVALR